MNKIINKTPHSVNILDDEHRIIRVFPKSKGMIRVQETVESIGEIEGIPLTKTTWGEAEAPKEKKGIYYIVSQLVKNALPFRQDLLVPKHVIRDEHGSIMGCKSLDIG